MFCGLFSNQDEEVKEEAFLYYSESMTPTAQHINDVPGTTNPTKTEEQDSPSLSSSFDEQEIDLSTHETSIPKCVTIESEEASKEPATVTLSEDPSQKTATEPEIPKALEGDSCGDQLNPKPEIKEELVLRTPSIVEDLRRMIIPGCSARTSCTTSITPKLYELSRQLRMERAENVRLLDEVRVKKRHYRRQNDDLKLAQQKIEYLQKELLRSEEVCREAKHEKQRLLESIQGSVVERTSNTKPGEFPGGDAIVDLCTEYGEDLLYLFKDMAHSLKESRSGRYEIEWAFYVIMENIIVQSYLLTGELMEKIIAEKEHQFQAFMGQVQIGNTLSSLVWYYSMQKHVATLSSNGFGGIVRLKNDSEELCWADNIGKFDDGQSSPSSVVGLCKAVLQLHLVCRFSSPECFLFPAVGERSHFDNRHQKQVFLNGEDRVAEGDEVIALFPGLYFVDPKDSSIKPKVKALVFSPPGQINA